MSKQVKIVALINKKYEDMSDEDFKKYWLENHAPLLLHLKNLKTYRINLPISEYQDLEVLPYAGSAELYWDSLDEMKEDFASEEWAAAGADGGTFLDGFHLYMEEHIIK